MLGGALVNSLRVGVGEGEREVGDIPPIHTDLRFPVLEALMDKGERERRRYHRDNFITD